MAEFWILYDLVIISIAVLCVWNGISEGGYKAVRGFIVTAASLLAAFLLSGPISEGVYNAFFRDTCQEFVEEKLERADVAGNVRGFLEKNGVYIPYSNDEMAQLIEDVQSNGSVAEQAASAIGIDAETLEDYLGDALDYAVESGGDIIPEWAVDSLKKDNGSFSIDKAADTTAALLRNDAGEAASGIEEAYVKPAVIPVIKGVVFTLLAFLLPILLRFVLRTFFGNGTGTGAALGGLMGGLKACIYIFLVVQLTACIAAAQNGSYPFFSESVIDKTYIFSIFYDMLSDIF